MAKTKIQNGQAEYGIVHLQEEEMREAGSGVFEKRSSAPKAKDAGAAPENKAKKAAPRRKRKAK